jgi:hypothetical protein
MALTMAAIADVRSTSGRNHGLAGELRRVVQKRIAEAALLDVMCRRLAHVSLVRVDSRAVLFR